MNLAEHTDQALTRVITAMEPKPAKKNNGYQVDLKVKELGITWDCSVNFSADSIDGGDVAIDDYDVAIVPVKAAADQSWIEVKYDDLSEDTKVAIEQACVAEALEAGRV